MSKTVFALVGNGPLTNRGCQAIVLGTRLILQREFGDSDFLLASFAQDSVDSLPENVEPLALRHERPRWSRAWWQYQASKLLRRPEDKSGFLEPLTAALRDREAPKAGLTIGGDGYSIDYGHFVIDRLVIMDEFLKSLGVPVIVWGASVGPFSREPEFERMMARHLAQLDLVVVRERRSFDYLRGLGLERNLRLAPDPGFVLPSTACALPDPVARLLEQPCLGVNLSPLLARFAAGSDMERLRKLATDCIAGLLTSFNLGIVLVPHVCSTTFSVNQDDELLLRGVYERLPRDLRTRVALAPRGLSCENLKWLIGRTHAFIGARMHATVAALSAGVPCILLAYSRKAWGVAELVYGDSAWVISPEELTPSALTERTACLLREHGRVKRVLNMRLPALRRDALAAGREVREVCGDLPVHGDTIPHRVPQSLFAAGAAC